MNQIENVAINRIFAMPSKNTFNIKPIRELIDRHMAGLSVDPFANKNRFATITNDLNPEFDTDYNLDAIEFLRTFSDSSIDTVLFDPPYSPRQVSEHYKSFGMAVTKKTTQSSFWGDIKKEIARIVKPNGKVISCGWNSGGIGKTAGFKQIEILMVTHGGWHNDTIVTVEQKVGEA